QGAVLSPIAAGGAPVGTGASRFTGYVQDGGVNASSSEPGALDALGYDAVQLLRAAWSSACPGGASGQSGSSEGPFTGAQINAALKKVAFDGASGPITFDVTGQRSGPAWLLRVEGSALRPVGR